MPAPVAAQRVWLRYLLGLMALGWTAGFVWFSHAVEAMVPAPPQKTDAIVALTGGSGRISRAIAVLERREAQRLLITGAHPQTTAAQLARLNRTSPALFECCIDVGRAAGDTIGNAAEAAIWARDRGFSSVRLVTSDYHMLRSRMEFKARMPGVVVLADPVASNVGIITLAGEYSKYIARRAWLGLRGRT